MDDAHRKERGNRILRGDARDSIDAAVGALRAGHVIAIPTDTVYGLAAAIDIPAAIQQIYKLKQRPEAKAIPILLSDISDATKVCAEFPELAEALAQRFWPGPLTIVVPASSVLSPMLTDRIGDGRQSVALRVPDHVIAREIIRAAGGALAVTSANMSGQREALNAAEALRVGNASPEFVVDGGQSPGGRPSTIVVAVGRSPILIRQGAIPFEEILTSANRQP